VVVTYFATAIDEGHPAFIVLGRRRNSGPKFPSGPVLFLSVFRRRSDGSTHVVDIAGSQVIPPWIARAAELEDFGYRLWSVNDFPATRLRNARDLLRYARYETSLADRLILLTALKEAGSLRLSEAITMASGTKVVPIISSMILQRLITIDLDAELIGPDSVIRCSQY